MKKLTALLLALVMVLAMNISALATAGGLGSDAATEKGVYEGSANSIDIETAIVITNNETTAAAGKTIYYPAMSFTHEYEAATVTDDTTVNDGTVTAHVKSGVGDALTITETDVAAGNTVLNGNGQAVVYATTNIAVDLTKFSSAGIYRYKITDTSTTGTNLTNLQDAGVVQGKNTDKEYFLDIYLKNGTSGLEIGGYVLTTASTEHITTAGENKASGFDDIQKNTDGTLNGTANLESNYSYTTYNVILHKDVAGAMGDKNNGFDFTVAVTNNDLNFGYDVTGNTKESLNKAIQYISGFDGAVELSHKGELKIWGLSPKATVNYTETNDTPDTYKVKVGTTADGADIRGEADITANHTMSAWDEAKFVAIDYAIDTTANLNALTDAVYYTNTLPEISPTGVVLRIAPYAIMLGAGVVLFIVLKVRKNKAAEA